MPLGTASIFNAYGVYVSSARAFASLDSILKNPPATATHLKITIDGPNRFRETDESNNSALLPKPVVPMPDFSLREASRTPNVIRTVLQNEGTVPSRAPEWEFRWLGADDKVLATSSRTVYSIAWPIPKQVRPFEIPYAQGREDAVNRFLKNPPAGTLALEIILDPQNQIAETREDNNTFRIKLDYPDLAFGAIAVSDGILKIEVKNQGITPAAPTDIWLQWWSASAPLNGSEAFQIASAVMPGTAYSATLSLKGTSPAEKLIGAPPEGATRLRLFLDGSRKVTELNEENNSTMVERSLFPKPEPTPTLTLSLSVQIIRAQAVTPLRSLIEKLVSILWQGYELSAQTDEALVGDQVRANMVIKNVGNAPATEVTIYLPCPEGTTWISTAANGVSQSRNSAEGLAMADLTEGSAHGLSAICKIEASAGEKGSVRFVGSAQIKEVTNKFNSNNVEITVKPRILSAKPDLEVGGTGLLPKEDVVKAANQPFEADFTAIVQNNGAVSAPASRARLRVDAGADGTWDTIGPAFANVGALDPDKTALVKFTVGWVAPLGRYGFEICANADKVFPESDEANNCTTDHFTLQAGEEPIFEEEVVE
ncbi:hypothetical protein A3H11_04615 [Candidatus Uhrbacteria bacterium RIFCSPLOWO2_12_FULL_47_10]|nr:MAG: hypothetical protein A3H11_04615 [Candidatus Uhrbacteria bacterium RIFCSPLOWO2_12_FULL_47_10]